MTTSEFWTRAGVILALLLIIVGVFFLGRWTMHREDLLAFKPPPHVPPPTHAKPDTIYPKPIILYQIVKDTNAVHRADSLMAALVSMRLDSAALYQKIAGMVKPWTQVDSVEHPWIWGKIETTVEPVLRHAFPIFYLDSVYTPPPIITVEEYLNWPWMIISLLAGLIAGGLIL